MELQFAFESLGIALGLGLLVGMQRQRVQSRTAGVRTFPLITILGTLSALLAESLGSWIVAAGLVGLAAMIVVGNVIAARLRPDGDDGGITTEVAALLMYLIGAYLVFGHREVAIVLAGTIAVLLYAKPVLHALVHRVGDKDIKAMMQFVLIAMVILPLLPDRAYGPFEVLNPRHIWLIVVLVVGISFGGYILSRALGDRVGVIAAGILGGVISSTATTVSYARRAAGAPGAAGAATVVIILASTVVYGRVYIWIRAVAPDHAWAIFKPVAVLCAVSIVLAGLAWALTRSDPGEVPEHENPTQLKSALVFGGLYALVLLAVAAARHYFGERAIFAVAAISGLTDMDAITLSTARMVQNDGVGPDMAWRAILIGASANMVFKAGIVAFMGNWTLFRRVALLFGIKIAVAVALLVFWPTHW